MKQLSMFQEEIEVGDMVYICGRPCTVRKKILVREEVYYELLDPTGYGATFILSRENFEVED